MSANVLKPENESDRLDALRRYNILDTPPDGAFDNITSVAADLFQVPIAIVSLVDNDRIWFKSHHGIEAQEVEWKPGLCASAILSPDIYQVCDARIDARTLAHPLVAGELGLQFYAAAPLRTHDGFNLGTLCIIDRFPRELTQSDKEKLTKLAALVMDQMELRLAARKVGELERAQRELNSQLRQANQAFAESEERFRDLFDEAPIPYVYESLDSHFLRANLAATTTLGIKPEEVAFTFGKSLVPDKPEAKRMFQAALATAARGGDPNGVVVELCRKDNSDPLWVQCWSKPTADGKFIRTMMVDITARVLLEQEQAKLQAQNEYLAEEVRSAHNFGDIIGDSPTLRRVTRQITLVAPTQATVLITGESGTGKELVARAIHDHSQRHAHPMISVNCGAIPETLFESEFFGHIKGAFTGALRDKAGRFELANGSTLFLDEIGEVPLPTQTKLLRVLQEQEVERVGETRLRKINVRIIAATNRDLRAEVDAGRFRHDLFYRLSVFPISIPPLRERGGDIPLLAGHFIRIAAKKMNLRAPKLTEAIARQLSAHDWPGNVRELQNAVERAVILTQSGPLNFDHLASRPLPSALVSQPTERSQLLTRRELKQQERETIAAALAKCGGKLYGVDGAASLLGMKPTTLASRIKSLGLKRK